MTDHSPRTLGFDLPVSAVHDGPTASLSAQSVRITLDLAGGPRTFESPAVRIGAYHGFDVMVRLSFGYDYDPEERKLTIRGNDDRTEDQLRLTTYLSGAADREHGQAPQFAHHAMPNEIGLNRSSGNAWADHVETDEALSASLRETAARCNDLIVETAIEGGVDAVLKLGPAPVVKPDEVEAYKAMFGEPSELSASLDPLSDLVRVQARIESTYVGTVTWKQDYEFANVIGSDKDPKPSGTKSWIELWANKCHGGHDTTECSSKDYFSNDATKTCGPKFIGGHVIPGKVAKKVAKGGTVYIFPICIPHNNDDSCHMKSIYNPEGVQMNYW